MRPEIFHALQTAPSGTVVECTEEEIHEYIAIQSRREFALSEQDVWDHLVAKLGFDFMHRLHLRRESPPMQWIEILCAAITKETPNAG